MASSWEGSCPGHTRMQRVTLNIMQHSRVMSSKRFSGSCKQKQDGTCGKRLAASLENRYSRWMRSFQIKQSAEVCMRTQPWVSTEATSTWQRCLPTPEAYRVQDVESAQVVHAVFLPTRWRWTGGGKVKAVWVKSFQSPGCHFRCTSSRGKGAGECSGSR